MRGFIVPALCLVLGAGAAYAQEPNPKFEVASVRLSAEATSTPANSRMSGGPGTADPERFTFTNLSLKQLLLKAYGLLNYQFSGPDWLTSIRINLQAKVPSGATEAQLNAMLQNLLVERFNLASHHEIKEMAVYELTVGKDGPKLKESDLSAKPPEHERGEPLRVGGPDKEGFPQIPPGLNMMLGRMTDGIMRWTGRQQPLSNLASFLGGELDRPVVDKTGLTGKYDFTLAHSRDGLRPRGPVDDTPSGGPSLFKAVQDQLGLNLESKKDPIDILVVDHIDKVPTDN
jgi:uncharacterized protein (TIGR03435 family)